MVNKTTAWHSILYKILIFVFRSEPFMEFILISPTHKRWNDCLQLYLSSFPVDERLQESELAMLSAKPGYSFFMLSECNDFVGFIEIWEMNGFLFLEHMAIMDVWRNQGKGSEAIRQVISKAHYPILLEAEKPVDHLSRRRIEFYKRLGFKPLHVNYVQPPYDPGKHSIPMLLLCNEQPDSDLIDNFVSQIRQKIYNVS